MASEANSTDIEPESLTEAVVGRATLDSPMVKQIVAAVPLPVRAAIAAAVFAGLVFLPYLGAVGLWDPWETHYGEVAREMIQRNDYVHPYWENAWFFSKPAFTMWMQATGMQLFGTGIGSADPADFEPMSTASVIVRLVMWLLLTAVGAFGLRGARKQFKNALPGIFWVGWAALPFVALIISHRVAGLMFRAGLTGAGADVGSPDAMGLYTEWGFRLPFALFSILAVGLLAYAVARTVSARAGMATGFVLVTMPLYFLISRQAVTDTPIIAATICAMACLIIAQLDTESKAKAGWWAGFYIFFSIGVLAKGLLALMPAVIFGFYYALQLMPWTTKAWQEHIRWVWEKALNPLIGGVIAAAIVYAGVAAAFGGYPNPIGHFVGLMPALGAFVITFMVMIDKVVKAEKTMPALFAQMFKMQLGTGVLLFLLIAIPWYWRMFSFEQVDDEGKLFWFRFLIHDHFSRLGAGVHTTTPGGDFTYFIEQGGFAMFPWVVLMPGALAIVSRLKLRSDDATDHVGLLAVLWFTMNFALIGSSATKFHHYVLPMLPGLALLMGLFIDRLWNDGFKKWGMSLIFGIPLLMLVGKDLAENPKDFTDLFVYNYDRPYPLDMVQSQINAWQTRPLWMSDLLAVAFLSIGLYLLFESFSGKHSKLFRGLAIFLSAFGGAAFAISATAAHSSPMIWFGVAFGATAGFFLYEGMKTKEQMHLLVLLGLVLALPALAFIVKGAQVEASKATPNAAVVTDPFLPLVTDVSNIKEVWGFAFLVGGVLLACIAFSRSRTAFFSTAVALMTAWCLWFNWYHWVALSHMWTQRDQFWRYYKLRQPNEPITAFLMNWRGETFYSRNTVKQIKDNNLLYQYAQQPGREFALVEHARLGILKGAVGPDKQVTLIDKDVNNKFVLVTIE